ncbi:MAG: YicC/YloC family endoribonuclease [Candidatus Omnitrophota bacterium]
MIKSMTGFGQAEVKTSKDYIRVELKTVNHKYLEVSLKLPPHLFEFEEKLRRILSGRLRRGKIYVFVSSPDPSVFANRLILNESLAKEVASKIARVRQLLHFKQEIPAEAILREVLDYPGVLIKDIFSDQHTLYWRDLSKALETAMAALEKSKIYEGKALDKDLRTRMSQMRKSLWAIEKRIPAIHQEFKKSLEARLKEFLKTDQIDRERVTVEVALFAKNSDISEEVTRLKSHLAGMEQALLEKGEVGKKLDFIAQEMLRETNTIGSKSADVPIAGAVIAIKSAIEKIREQSQNIE